MYIRCTECKRTAWVEILREDDPPPSVTCQSCGREHGLQNLDDLGPDTKSRYELALATAESNGIDLPSAYSVLLGIMTLGAAMQLSPEDLSANRREDLAKKQKKSPIVPASTFDSGFRQAVSEGHLTPQQAMQRGSRDALASRLAARHNLSMELAYDIADNRKALRVVMREQPNTAVATAKPPEVPVSRAQKAWILGSAATLVVAATLLISQGGADHAGSRALPASSAPLWSEDNEAAGNHQTAAAEHQEAAPMRPSVDVEKNADGQPLKITGPSPKSVLTAYCSENPRSHMLEPVELVPSVPPFAGTRIGIFRDLGGSEPYYGIRIRMGGDSRWTTGDGVNPIDVTATPRIPLDAQRIAVAGN